MLIILLMKLKIALTVFEVSLIILEEQKNLLIIEYPILSQVKVQNY